MWLALGLGFSIYSLGLLDQLYTASLYLVGMILQFFHRRFGLCAHLCNVKVDELKASSLSVATTDIKYSI